jgi:hypothetical protein
VGWVVAVALLVWVLEQEVKVIVRTARAARVKMERSFFMRVILEDMCDGAYVKRLKEKGADQKLA